MKSFDVVVVGAGPAGGHMARIMAKSGYNVLLVEQQESFTTNNFSSAVTLLSTLEQFDLPPSIIGSFWNQFVAITTNTKQVWQSQENLGVVLDFAKLKEFLAHEVKALGSEVWLGHRYLQHSQENGKTKVILKHRSQGTLATIYTQVLVDATGFARAVMYDQPREHPKLLSGTGIEYLVTVDEAAYQKYAQSIFFFLGHQWMPKGYGWIFPMEPCHLKVGVGKYDLEHRQTKQNQSLQSYIQQLIDQHIQPQEYHVLDIHGSMIKYSQGLQDIYYRDNAIAIGDAVSTVNFLGGEGIRHGMYSAEVAARYVCKYLERQISDFQGYQQQLRQHFLPEWDISAKLAVQQYLFEGDEKLDQIFTYLGLLTTEEIIDVLFHYRFGRLKKGSWRYLKAKLLGLLSFRNWRKNAKSKLT